MSRVSLIFFGLLLGLMSFNTLAADDQNKMNPAFACTVGENSILRNLMPSANRVSLFLNAGGTAELIFEISQLPARFGVVNLSRISNLKVTNKTPGENRPHDLASIELKGHMATMGGIIELSLLVQAEPEKKVEFYAKDLGPMGTRNSPAMLVEFKECTVLLNE